MEIGIMPWIGFLAFILMMLLLDLGVFHRSPHVLSAKESALWSGFWILLAFIFNGVIWASMGTQPALEFLTAYLLEKSLSMDNIFVFMLIFKHFSVPPLAHHRVLFWGIFGAILMRAVFIGVGVQLVTYIHPILYLFGLFLLYVAYKMFQKRNSQDDRYPVENPVLRWISQRIPLTKEYVGQKFFIRRGSALYATPLLLVLVSVEISDLLFAADSLPAILAVTTDSYLIFTSNIFAILGLRSLYFVFVSWSPRFYYMKHALALILGFIGSKMVLMDLIQIPTALSLAFILVVFVGAIVFSIQKNR